MDILALAQARAARTVELRRHFHRNPEAGPEEQHDTMVAIEAELDALGIPHERVPGGGVFGFIEGGAPGRTLLLRSDIDALRIGESPDNLAGPKACVSQRPGLSHACGHDAHIAMLLAEAAILKEMALPGRIVLMFEQGEEKTCGILPLCRYISASGLHIDGCYATHVRWDIPTGRIGVCSGTAMMGLYQFHLTIDGASGHGSRPDLAKNTIDCLHMIYSALEMQRMTFVRPDTRLTWSICHVEAGVTHNIIPDHLLAEGTVRFEDRESGAAFWRRFHEIAQAMGALCGCTVSLTHRGYLLPTAGEPHCMAMLEQAADAALGAGTVIPCEPWMASESFSYMTSMYPGAFCFVGIRNDALGTGANHHTPEFDVDESAMVTGVTAAVAYARAFLTGAPDTAAFAPLCPDMDALIELVTAQ
ncbi:MAG: M20 family metallopeptidase [Candidatus Ventricola sp.]